MNKVERMTTAILHEEPDKVPRGEMEIEPIVMQRILGDGYVTPTDPESEFLNLKRTLEILNSDLVCIQPDLYPSSQILDIDKKGNTLYRDAWGFEFWLAPHGGAKRPHRLLFNEPQQVYDYEFPKAADFSMAKLAKWATETDYFIFNSMIATVGIGYTRLGFENFMTWTRTNPKEVCHWYENICELNIALAERCVKAGAHAILFDDDIAFNSGPFLSPQIMREHVFPFYARQVRAAKRLGVPAFFHSDGQLTKLLNDLVDVVGYDGWQSVQSDVNDIKEIKERYGDRLVLWGNISIDLLGRGTPEQVRDAVAELIPIAAPGGGFILSSSNSLGWETSASNARALYDAAEELGWYGRGEGGVETHSRDS